MEFRFLQTSTHSNQKSFPLRQSKIVILPQFFRTSLFPAQANNFHSTAGSKLIGYYADIGCTLRTFGGDVCNIGRKRLNHPFHTKICDFPTLFQTCGRRGGLMVSALDCGSSGPGSSLGRGVLRCVPGQDT